MKLRNKKTGVVIPIEIHNIGGKNYGSLKEINADWEDYEEPHEPYRLTTFGEVVEFSEGCLSNKYKRMCVDIGNYFATQEEAEKAATKLKAWKWLKDNGVGFKYDKDKFILYIVVSGKISPNQWRTGGYMQKLDLLFGGEE